MMIKKTISPTGLCCFILSFFALSIFTLPISYADVLTIPLSKQTSEKHHVSRPKIGMTTEQVISQYGQPITRGPAIGTPPISRWEYSDYFVFFEHEHVIHAVLKHHPKNL